MNVKISYDKPSISKGRMFQLIIPIEIGNPSLQDIVTKAILDDDKIVEAAGDRTVHAQVVRALPPGDRVSVRIFIEEV